MQEKFHFVAVLSSFFKILAIKIREKFTKFMDALIFCSAKAK